MARVHLAGCDAVANERLAKVLAVKVCLPPPRVIHVSQRCAVAMHLLGKFNLRLAETQSFVPLLRPEHHSAQNG